MSEDPAHKAMLYFLEVLMNSNGPLTISQLAGRFGSRNFSADMRSAAGGNESGLKKFLLKYPSLFTVRNNMVSLFDGKSSPSSSGEEVSSSTAAAGETGRSPLPDVSTELAAVQYFQQRLIKKEEKWVQICSLAGHLSQAEPNIRGAVGPQLDFKKWLLRHPHIFDVQGELVGLKDGVAAVATPAIPRRITFDETPYVKPVPPKTPPATRRIPKSPAAIRRSHSFGEKHMPLSRPSSTIISPEATPDSTPQLSRKDAPITMTANEYKAVTFLKDIIEKKGAVRLHSITSFFSQASEGIRNTIGWTRPEIDKFVRSHTTVFSLEEDLVSVVKNAKLNVIITGSRPSGGPVRTLNARKGKIFHVAKLWGIIDLGKHEHVFFDKSIMRRPVEDLSKEYKPNETLYFHAVLAPKSSRAKWRATHVWRESEQTPSGSQVDLSNIDTGSGGPLSPTNSIEDEINRFLPQDTINTPSLSDKYSDADSSSSGSVRVFNYKGMGGSSMVPERYQLTQASELSPPGVSPPLQAATTPLTNGVANGTDSPVSVVQPVKKFAEIGCQTISTGDIIATHLYYED